jgi:hypothetical protein
MHLKKNNVPVRWKRIAAFAEAEKLDLSLMFVARAIPLAQPPPDREPDEEEFKEQLQENLLANDGCGLHIQIEKVSLPEEDTYFVYYNRIRSHKNIFDASGKFQNDEIDRDANDLCFVYDKINGKVYVRAPKGSRRNRKLKLCEIFAATMLRMAIEVDDPNKYQHELNHIFDDSFSFAQDKDGKIKKVRVCEVCVITDDVRDDFQLLRSNTSRDLLPDIQTYDRYLLYKNCKKVINVTLAISFCPEFSKRKTPLKVKITTDSLTKIRNQAEKEVVEEQLREWRINAL